MPETTMPRPPFDPELAVLLTALEARGPFTIDAAALPRMRALDVSEQELDDRLRSRGLERRSITSPATAATRSTSR